MIRVGKVRSHNSLRFLSLGLFFLLVQVGVMIVKLESKAVSCSFTLGSLLPHSS